MGRLKRDLILQTMSRFGLSSTRFSRRSFTSAQTLDLAEVKERLARLNYYAAQTIKATRGGEKWIALVGQAHERACCFTCP